MMESKESGISISRTRASSIHRFSIPATLTKKKPFFIAAAASFFVGLNAVLSYMSLNMVKNQGGKELLNFAKSNMLVCRNVMYPVAVASIEFWKIP